MTYQFRDHTCCRLATCSNQIWRQSEASTDAKKCRSHVPVGSCILQISNPTAGRVNAIAGTRSCHLNLPHCGDTTSLMRETFLGLRTSFEWETHMKLNSG